MASSEALSLVALTPADVPGGLALSGAAGWNQTADDWMFFIEHGHAMGFHTTSGNLVCTAATVVYSGSYGWITMVLVASEWRHRGLASLVTDGCLKRLQVAHVTPVVDATPAGMPVYRHLGFRSGFEFDRWQGAGPFDALASSAEVREGSASDLDAIAALDQDANDVGRRPLLQNFLARAQTRVWLMRDGSGFTLARVGRRAVHVGPLVAGDAATAIMLLTTALHAIGGPVFFDLPRRWPEITTWLEARGFTRQRPFARMVLGRAAPLACGDRVFGLAGPEYG